MEKVKPGREPLAGYRTAVDIQTRFRDTDAMGHLNNSVYLSFLELARFEYLRSVLGVTSPSEVGIIVARVEIDYRSPAFLSDALAVGARVSRLGGASFSMDYKIVERRTGRLVAEAVSVQVAYDYKAGRVRKLTPDFVAKVRSHDGLS